MSDAVSQIRASRRFADMFEFRMDLIREPDIVGLLNNAQKPVVVACRTKREGGMYRGNDRDRAMLLELGSAFGAAYVDIELSDGKELLAKFIGLKSAAKVLLSCHMSKPPEDVSALYRKMRQSGAAILKLAYEAVDAHQISHAIRFLAIARKDRQQAIAVAMGDAGEASRVLYNVFGGWGTFASAEHGPSAAPGQIQGSVLRKLFRAHALDKQTQVFGVIGHPLAQSKGVHLHNPLFAGAGSKAVYCRFPVMNLSLFMKHIAPLLAGFSVTIPHKQKIIPFLQSIDPAAREIGAVNTVLRRQEGLWGTNTDGAGALDAIEESVKVSGKEMLLIGAGGAARAILYEAKKRGADVLVANRTAERAKHLAREFGVRAVVMRDLQGQKFDILVNATSVGMVPNDGESPVPKNLIKGKAVFDVVYNPPVTRFLREAADAGAVTISGMEMYINQAARQSELYTGKKPSRSRLRRLLST
jgi:3-dehydroquinate dehydratase/shikimate dehydrogenase